MKRRKTGTMCECENNVKDFLITEYPDQIYSVSSNVWSKQVTEGGAIMQTWIIKGKDRLLAIDSPVPELQGFQECLEREFGIPVLMVNSHGHIDHVGCNSQFQEVWLAKEDWSLVAGGGVVRNENPDALKSISYSLRDIPQGYVFELGERNVISYHVPGHTLGSVVFYDEKSKGLFSGDAVARRVLYGISDWTPLSDYISALEFLQKLEISGVYSMHDNFILPKDMPKRVVDFINDNLQKTSLVWSSPTDGRVFKRILLGKSEKDKEFFDFVIPLDKIKEGKENV